MYMRNEEVVALVPRDHRECSLCVGVPRLGRWGYRLPEETVRVPVCALCALMKTVWGQSQRVELERLIQEGRALAAQAGKPFTSVGADGNLTPECAESLLKGVLVVSLILAKHRQRSESLS